MKRFICCLILAIPFYVFGALQMKCISVNGSGGVTLNWVNTSSSVLFRSYHIYHANTTAGPYVLIDSITSYSTQSYLDVNANANSINAFYYVTLNNTNGSVETGDTLRAIRLNVIDPGDGYASLIWNGTHTPPVSSNSVYNLVFREYQIGRAHV